MYTIPNLKSIPGFALFDLLRKGRANGLRYRRAGDLAGKCQKAKKASGVNPTKSGELPPLSERKRNSHSKNIPQQEAEIRAHLRRICGVDITVVDGFGVGLAQTVISEIGTDMRRFPNEKHFCSWLGLAPKNDISGGKVLKNAAVATAHAIARVIYRMLKFQVEYEPVSG